MKRYVVCWFYIIFCKACSNIFYFEYISKSTSTIERSRNFTVCLVSSNFRIWNSVANKTKKSICKEPSLYKKLCPPLPPKHFREGCVISMAQSSPNHSQAHDFYSKGDCMYVLCWRKEEGARGNSVLSANYSIRIRAYGLYLKIVALLPRTTKTFPRRNISVTLANNFVCCSSSKKIHRQFWKSPVFTVKGKVVLLMRT